MSIIKRDKAILLYAIVTDITFDLEYMIQNSIMEFLQTKCTDALTRQYLITLLCKLASVPIVRNFNF